MLSRVPYRGRGLRDGGRRGYHRKFAPLEVGEIKHRGPSEEAGGCRADLAKIPAIARDPCAETSEYGEDAEPAADLHGGPETEPCVGRLTGVNAKAGADSERRAQQQGKHAAAERDAGEFCGGRVERWRGAQAV